VCVCQLPVLGGTQLRVVAHAESRVQATSGAVEVEVEVVVVVVVEVVVVQVVVVVEVEVEVLVCVCPVTEVCVSGGLQITLCLL